MRSLPPAAILLSAVLLQGCSSTAQVPAHESVFDMIDRQETQPNAAGFVNGKCPAPTVPVCVSHAGRIGGKECACMERMELTDRLSGGF